MVWGQHPYCVVNKLQDNVYVIQLADGSGPLKSVTRREICDLTNYLGDQPSYLVQIDNPTQIDAPPGVVPEHAEDSIGSQKGAESEESLTDFDVYVGIRDS